MSVSIQSCPSCRTLLLTDTVQCPLCQHVVNPGAAESFVGELPAVVAIDDREDGVECADCGEVVRPELVRCWRCGAFLRPEIAARYQEMQRNPSPVIYSQDYAAGDAEDTALASAQQSSSSGAATITVGEEGGFELADGVNMSDGVGFERDDELIENTESASASDQSQESSGVGAGRESEPDSDPSDGDDTSHPIAASGDALLDIAMTEEAETKTRRRHGTASATRGGARATAKTGFIVFCPNGHPIEVQERHRGKSGKCPRCQSPFLVPQQNWDPTQASEEVEEKPEESDVDRLFVEWLDDVRLHQVSPRSLKLKAGSLATKFNTVDLGLSAEILLLVKLVKSGGLFGSGAAKKGPQVREEVRAFLEDVRSTDGLPAAEFISLSAETCTALRIVQPAPYAHESMFAGIEVFGEGRIAIRLPEDPESKTIDFLSFSLSEFRRVSGWLEELYGIVDFGADVGVPLQDSLKDVVCHYNEETTMTVVDDATYYAADDAYELTRVGFRCQSCGLVVSEDARKKEKIGGKAGKGLAKAVCPKCKRAFGDNPLHAIKLAGSDDEGGEEEEVADEALADELAAGPSERESVEQDGDTDEVSNTDGMSVDENSDAVETSADEDVVDDSPADEMSAEEGE